MRLVEREKCLLVAFRRLPPDTATELSALTERLAELAPNRRIDWSDSWSDEDLSEFRVLQSQLGSLPLTRPAGFKTFPKTARGEAL